MTNADVAKDVEGTLTTYSNDQQLDAALSEKLARCDAILVLCGLPSSFITRSFAICVIPDWLSGILQAVRISRKGLQQNCTAGCRHSRCQPVCSPVQ